MHSTTQNEGHGTPFISVLLFTQSSHVTCSWQVKPLFVCSVGSSICSEKSIVVTTRIQPDWSISLWRGSQLYCAVYSIQHGSCFHVFSHATVFNILPSHTCMSPKHQRVRENLQAGPCLSENISSLTPSGYVYITANIRNLYFSGEPVFLLHWRQCITVKLCTF